MKRPTLAPWLVTALACLVILSAGCAAPARTGSSGATTTVAPVAPSTPPASVEASPSVADTPTVFAVIGDYGWRDAHELAVSKMIATWKPAFILTMGDDYYAHAGGTGTAKYDQSTGSYYGAWLKDIHTTGTHLRVGRAKINAFFPALGNHDYGDATPSPKTYLTYFTLPGSDFRNTSGNERYYDFVEGPVHFFVLNSNTVEAAGTSSTSNQAEWLKAQLAASTSPWDIVYDHHPPYSSDSSHGSSKYMQWPFAAWGADVVISGHAHTYERIMRNGIVYFVDGLGGAPRYAFKAPVAGSAVRYNANWGALRATVTSTTLDFEFLSVGGRHVDKIHLATGLSTE